MNQWHHSTLKGFSLLLSVITLVACDSPSLPRQSTKGTAGAYLLNDNDVSGLSIQLVLPYQPIGDEGFYSTEESPAGQVSALSDFVAEQLNSMMALPALAPGRRFHVVVEDSLFVNAFADSFQNIVFLAPILRLPQSTGKVMLSILCHEIGHSARNHGYQIQRAIGDTSRTDEAHKNLLDHAYNADAEIYTHDAVTWRKWIDLEISALRGTMVLTKRTESEADVVGGMICAEMGLSPQDYLESFSQLDAILKVDTSRLPAGTQWPSELPDGASFGIRSFDLNLYLHHVPELDDHPSNAERVAQIQHFLPAIGTHYRSDNQAASRFITGFDQALAAAAEELNGLDQSAAKLHGIQSSTPTSATDDELTKNPDGSYTWCAPHKGSCGDQ